MHVKNTREFVFTILSTLLPTATIFFFYGKMHLVAHTPSQLCAEHFQHDVIHADCTNDGSEKEFSDGVSTDESQQEKGTIQFSRSDLVFSLHHPDVLGEDLLGPPLKALDVFHALQARQIWKETNLIISNSSTQRSYVFIQHWIFFFFVPFQLKGAQAP